MKPRIYLDTSVIGGCFDSEFELASRTLFEEIAQGKFLAVISEIVKIRRFNAINMLHGYRQIEIRSPMEVIHYE